MAAISFEFLFKPVEEVDSWLTGLFSGAPLIVALGIHLLDRLERRTRTLF